MDSIISIVTSFFYQHRYIFTFLGSLFEGTYIMILAGAFLKWGYFKFWGLMPILIGGYFLNGLGWYLIGRTGGKEILNKWGKKLRLTKDLLEKLERYFKKHSIKTLFITRITYGLSMPTLIMAGSFKVKWKKFLIVNLIASFIWVLMMFSLGYIFGVSYEILSKIIKTVAIWLTVILFIIIILVPIISVYWLRRRTKIKFVEKIMNYKNLEKVKWLSDKIYKFLDDNI